MTVTAIDYHDWRDKARRLLSRAIGPNQVMWLASSAQEPLPFPAMDAVNGCDSGAKQDAIRVPRAFATLAEFAACHRSAGKWDQLYRLLWRVVRDGARVLDQESSWDVRAVKDMAAQVGRDEHKMRAFVRFAPVADAGTTRYVAWYEPDHLIVRRAAPFFAERFASMSWSILTPDASVHWNGEELSFSEGVERPTAAEAGEMEQLWRAYYSAVFNPARANLRATLREMPLRRWRRLPEAALIPALLNTAHERTARVDAARTGTSALPFVPESTDLDALRRASSSCRGCRLHEAATQVVFGDGPGAARIVLVGEQPGDAEDVEGRPFVGPAGQVLDSALATAGIDRRDVYLTNAVKHFSFEPRGKRRIHQTPRLSEVHACRPWLEAELQAIRPTTVVALGSTSARALLGPQARVMALRGRVLQGLSWAARVIVTLHPSAVVRAGEEGERYFGMLVSDLMLAEGPLRERRGEA